jgi:LPXTG-motif cell wall-anchored protein
MKILLAIWFFLSIVCCCHAQKIQVIAPKQVVEGNAFQLQYIINDPSSFETISTPRFDNLRLITGPNYYKGNSLVNGKTQAIENITYTVVPLKAGTIRIAPVTIQFKNSDEETTREITITAIPQPRASFNALSTYTDINLYAPSSKTDLDKLIEENLFVKTEVDKKSCFLGEAITATFKLYSRLQSTSEVINAPSLYGFSVMDILNINEAHQAVETVNGKIFNTSILRKLQLFPSQAGRLVIDEMQLQNSIEFDDSLTGKKTKVEKLMASNPVEIKVKPLPSAQPAGYTGAVGQFKVVANLPDSIIEANKQGQLIITISGKGNFIQFSQPAIEWPKGFDVFDPVISDQLNKNTIPTEGSRKYIFSFTASQAGNFTIPSIVFSYFVPGLQKYKEARSEIPKLEILPATSYKKDKEEKGSISRSTNIWVFLLGIMLLLFLAAIFLRKTKKETIQKPVVKQISYVEKLDAITARDFSGKPFCSEIQKLLGAFAKEYSLSETQKSELEAIQNDCQLLIYSHINSEGKQVELEKRTRYLFRQLEP